VANLPDEQFIERIADRVGLDESGAAPRHLRAKLYSALVQQQAKTGRLMSLTAIGSGGRRLCIFEKLVQIAPVGEATKSLNFCRVCHARVLAERVDNPPIYWSGCPYVEFKKS